MIQPEFRINNPIEFKVNPESEKEFFKIIEDCQDLEVDL